MHFSVRLFEKKSQSTSNLFKFLKTIVTQKQLLLHKYYLQLSFNKCNSFNTAIKSISLIK